jgi:hypothetical protein
MVAHPLPSPNEQKMPRNFIIFFEEKEGTTAIVYALAEYHGVTVIHQTDDLGWEPFDRHNSGEMPLRRLRYCLETLYSGSAIDFDRLNSVYTQTAMRPLASFGPSDVLGLKMRFKPPPRWQKALPLTRWMFKKMMFALLKEHDIFAFVAVRQDVLKWALSKYHGDGSGRRGHLQFKVAQSVLDPSTLPKINVDLKEFEKLVQHCEHRHLMKHKLMDEFRAAGIGTAPLLYETFNTAREEFFQNFFSALGMPAPHIDPSKVRVKSQLKKVHSDDISTFVANHEEVVSMFGDRFVRWA